MPTSLRQPANEASDLPEICSPVEVSTFLICNAEISSLYCRINAAIAAAYGPERQWRLKGGLANGDSDHSRPDTG
jgi:hypothetical protein